MPDFSYMQAYHVRPEQTAEYEFSQIVGRPRLTVVHAGDENRELQSALRKWLKKSGLQRRIRRDAETSDDNNEMNRILRILFSKHVVKGWSNVVDTRGEPVEFNEDNCLSFLEALPLDMWRDFMEFTNSESSFRDPDCDPILTHEEAEELGNS